MKTKALVLLTVVAMVFLALLTVGLAEKEIFTTERIEGRPQKEVLVNGEKRVIYCMQYDYVWPAPEGEGFANAPAKFWEASGDELLLNAEQTAIIQRVLYAGYPYDSLGIFAEFTAQSMEDAAADATQHVIWTLMAKWGIEGNNHYGASSDPDDSMFVQAANKLMDYALHGAPLRPAPTGFVPSVEGNLAFEEKDGVWTSGLLSITNPEGFVLSYTLEFPEDVILLDENGDPVWPRFDYVNDEFVFTYVYPGGKGFYLQADDVTSFEGQTLTITGDVKIPTDIKQYSTNDTHRADKDDGQGYTQHPVQTMVSVGIDAHSYNGSATLSAKHPWVIVPVSKVWSDGNDQDGKRPNSVVVYLLADEKRTGDTLVLNAGNHWHGAFADLPEKDSSGRVIKYTIEEERVPGYTTAYSGNAADGYVVTNSHTPETMTISGKKTWDDADNQDGKRPYSITIRLRVNGVDVDHKDVTAKDNWEWSFSNLPKYQNGEEIEYTISEDTVEGYSAEYDGYYNVTNRYTPGKISLTVEKEWEDHGDQDGKRPNDIKIHLLANGKDTGKMLVLSAGDKWEGVFTDLPEYENGKKIHYEITEEKIPGYSTVIKGNNEIAYPDAGFLVINSHEPETTSFEGSKTWVDANNQDGKRPHRIIIRLHANGREVKDLVVTEADHWKWNFTDLPKYEHGHEIVYTITEDHVENYTTEVNGFDVTNRYTPGKVGVFVEKDWEDNDDQDGKRPASVIVHLVKNGKDTGKTITLNAHNDWEGSFNNLDEFEAGKRIHYAVREEAVGEYNEPVISGNAETGYLITNSRTPEPVAIEGSKTWDDNDNAAKERPGEIIIRLHANGEEKERKVVTEADGWEWSFKDLPKYHKGHEIVYTITEDQIEDYSTTLHGFDVTNKYTPGKTSLFVEKEWEDSENQDGVRPKEITIWLWADGKKTDKKLILNADNEWEGTFQELDEYKDGKRVHYTITEEPVKGYETEIVGDEKKGYLVLNGHVTEEVTISVSKVWDDANDKDNIRPDSITIELNDGDVMIDHAVVTANDNWECSFNDLPKYRDGKKINYSIAEKEVANYTTTISGSVDKGFVVTNKHKTSKPDGNEYRFTFTKKWVGGVESSIKWTLYSGNGKPVQKAFNKLKSGSETEWKYETWFSSDADYYLIEDVPAGYVVRYENVGKHADVTDRCYNGGTIINYKPPKTGDNGSLAAMIGLLVLSVTGLILFMRKRKAE